MESPKRPIISNWHHSPKHGFVPGVPYIVTAATLYKRHYFDTSEKLGVLQQLLLEVAEKCNWDLDEWSLFSNHYHLIGMGRETATPLHRFIQSFHAKTAQWLNRRDGTPGRRVWYEFWDTALTYEASYYARLNYVYHNPAHHGLVERAEDYPFCSARRMLIQRPNTRQRRMQSYKYDEITILDDFDPVWMKQG